MTLRDRLLGWFSNRYSGEFVDPEDVQVEPLHPKENPVLQTYLLQGEHGSLRKYILELMVVLGVMIPWIGPAFGLCVMTPIVLLTIENGKIITSDQDCFGTGPVGNATECPAESYFDYYFWNITNVDEVVAGAAPPVLQELGPYTFLVKETRWNTTFSASFDTVNYSSLNTQYYVAEQSCPGCNLTNDHLITVNRAYLAFLNVPEIGGNDALAFIPSVPLAMRQIVAGITAALEAAGFPAAYAPTAAISQWGRCAFGFPAQLTGKVDPTNPTFGNWLNIYQGLPYSVAGTILTDAQAGVLLTLFQGNPALDSPAGYNGALNVELFAFYPAASVVATLSVYYPSLGLTALQVELIQGYLYWVCEYFIVPTALYGGPTGMPLGPQAGGMFVDRSIYDWIYGWPDPLVHQNVSMAFAFAANDTASALFNLPTVQLSYTDSPLIFSYSLETGLIADTQPYNALAYDDSSIILAYPDTPLPFGQLPVTGSAGGLQFPIDVHPSSQFQMFDNTFDRSLNISFTGEVIENQGVDAWEFSLIDTEVSGCNFTNFTDRCVYPDMYSYTFNATLTYACPTILAFPHYYKADPVLAASTGFNFSPNAAEHEWMFAIEPVSGFAITGSKGYQISHLVQRSTFLYPNVWLNTSSGIDGMWLPTFWARSRFQPTTASAAQLRGGLFLRRVFIVWPVIVAPAIFGAVLVIGTYFLVFTPRAKRVAKECEELRRSQARSTDLSAREAASVAYLPGPADKEVKKRSSIMDLEENYYNSGESASASGSQSYRSSEFTPREYIAMIVPQHDSSQGTEEISRVWQHHTL